MNNSSKQSGGGKKPGSDQPFWEKFVAAIGLLLFVLMLGYLLYDAFRGDASPPNVGVEIKEVRASGNDFLVIFEASNSGGSTAQGVVIRGELKRFGIAVETAETVVDYVPVNSTRTGGLFFRNDPRKLQLSIAPSGYTRP